MIDRDQLREAIERASAVAQQMVEGCDEFDSFVQVLEAARVQLNDPILPGKPGEPDVERVTARVVDLLVSHGKVLSPIGTRPATVDDLIQALRVVDPDTLIISKVDGEWPEYVHDFLPGPDWQNSEALDALVEGQPK